MPFTVITLKKTTPSLKGDLTKWMQEIATGVYIGNFNTRIREKIWNRVIETVGHGEATMSYACRNEIGYQFVTWNTERENIDYEGIPLVLIPKHVETELDRNHLGFSNASKFRNVRKFSSGKCKEKLSLMSYVVIDIETDGLDENHNSIIEIGAVKVDAGTRTEFSRLIYQDKELPDKIKRLTGIDDEMLKAAGIDLGEAIGEFLSFVGDAILIGYAVDFDIRFLNKAIEKTGHKKLTNTYYDLMRYVKKEKMFLKDYKLETALESYGILEKVPHRALKDAVLIEQLVLKVNKLQDVIRKK